VQTWERPVPKKIKFETRREASRREPREREWGLRRYEKKKSIRREGPATRQLFYGRRGEIKRSSSSPETKRGGGATLSRSQKQKIPTDDVALRRGKRGGGKETDGRHQAPFPQSHNERNTPTKGTGNTSTQKLPELFPAVDSENQRSDTERNKLGKEGGNRGEGMFGNSSFYRNRIISGAGRNHGA